MLNSENAKEKMKHLRTTKTQNISELLSANICVPVPLCTTIVYNTAWRSSDYQSSCYIFEGVEHYFTLINIHQLEETTEASSYHVAEHRPVRSESLQPHIERSSRLWRLMSTNGAMHS